MKRLWDVLGVLVFALSPFAAYGLTTGWMMDLLPWSSSLFLALWASAVLGRILQHRNAPRAFAAGAFVATWMLEVLGVRTGVPFGVYRYTGVLQPELAGVPLVIPLAWVGLLLLATAWVEVRAPQSGLWERALRVGLLLVGVDVLLEPMAAYEGRYWEWMAGAVPLQNYGSWGVVGFVGALLLSRHGKLALPESERPWLWGLAGVLLGLCLAVGIAGGHWGAMGVGVLLLVGASIGLRRR
jgi:putative membrane protein